MKRRKQNQLQRHHIIPKSKNGGYEKNILLIPEDYHVAYHKLFANLTPEEILFYLKEVLFTTGRFKTPLDWLNKRPQK